MIIEWLGKNWDKMAMIVLSVVTAVWAAARRFMSRLESTERALAEVRAKQAALEEGLAEVRRDGARLKNDIFERLDRLQGKLDDIVELKIFVERSDVTLAGIQDDIRELKSDVKSLMRRD